MATTFSWATPAGGAVVVTGTAFNALANNTCLAGTAVTAGANPPLMASYLLNHKFAAGAIAANTVIMKCWFMVDPLGGTAYDDGATLASTTPPGRAPDFIFATAIARNAQAGVSQSIPLIVQRPSNNFKILVQNVAGFAAAADTTSTVLNEATQNEYGT